MAHPLAWTLKIELYSGSFEGVKAIAKQTLDRIVSAKSFKELPMGGGGGCGGDPIGSGFSVVCHSPAEARIVALREEADALEKTLQQG